MIGLALLLAPLRADDTEVEELRARINALADAGQNKEALPWIDRLLAVRRATFGDAHPDIGRTYISYAQTHERLGDFAEAERWHEKALALLEQSAPEKEELAFCLTQYGWFLKNRVRYDRAQPLLERALAIREMALGAGHPETAWSVRNLAWVHRLKGELPRAIALFEQCDALREKVRGPLHAETLNNRHDLAHTLLLAGQRERAIAIFRENAERQERATGSTSAEFAYRLLALGEGLGKDRKFAESAQVLQRALTLRETLGAEHGDTITTLHLLAWALHLDGRHDEAEPHFRRAVELSTKLHGERHATTVEMLRSLTTFFMNRKRTAEFVSTARRVAELGEQLYGAADERVQQFRAQLVAALDSAGDTAAALPVREAMLAHHRAQPNRAGALIDSVLETAEACHAAGQHKRAATLREEALGLLRQTTPENAARIAQTMGKLAASREALEQWESAEILRQDALAFTTEKLGPDSEEARQAVTDVGWLLKARQRFAEAEPHLLRAVAGAERRHGRQHFATAWALRNFALLQRDWGKPAEARASFEQAIAILRALGGEPDGNGLTILADCASLLEDLRLYTDAEPLRREVLTMREKLSGLDHEWTVSARRNLAWVYRKTGRFAEAEKLYRSAADAVANALGADHPRAIAAVERLGFLYRDWRRHPQAIDVFDKVLTARQRVLGATHEDTLETMDSLSRALRTVKDFARAESLARSRLDLITQERGAEHGETASALVGLAATLADMKHWPEAEECYRRALAVREKVFGPESKEAADSCVNLGWCLKQRANYEDAETFYQRALSIRTARLGETHLDTIDVIDDLGYLHEARRDFLRARAAFEQELAALEKVGSRGGSATVDCLQELGWLAMMLGDVAAGDRHYRRALDLARQIYGPAHEEVGTCQSGLALVAMARGDFAAAQPHARAAFEVSEKVYGPDDRETATALATLGTVDFYLGDHAGASGRFERALAILERAPDTAVNVLTSALSQAAMSDLALGRRASGIQRAERAIDLLERSLGDDHPLLFAPLYTLSLAYMAEGNLPAALRCAQRNEALNLKTLGARNYQTATAALTVGLLAQLTGESAIAVEKLSAGAAGNEEVLGLHNPVTAMSLMMLAAARESAGDAAGARTSALRHQEALDGVLANVLSFGSEQQRLDFQAQSHPFAALASLGDAGGLARAVLRHKGIVLDSLLEDRRVAASLAGAESQQRLAEMREKKQRLFQLSMESPKDATPAQLSQRAAERESLAAALAAEESQLARHATALGRTRASLGITPEQVQAALRPGIALVEFVRVEIPAFSKNAGNYYGAVVFAPGAELQWLNLGAAEEIDDAVRLFQLSARGKTDETTLQGVLPTLHRQLWHPVQAALPLEVKSVVLCPDGELSFVSFAALLDDDGRFLAERFALRYAASGRDLLKEIAPAPSRTLAIFADPIFGVAANTPIASTRDLRSTRLSPLPGTAREARALAAAAASWQWPANVFTQADAAEEKLAALSAARVLHLATHGFFLPEITRPAAKDDLLALFQFGSAPARTAQNPMHRAGIALAGAQRTLDAWARGEAPSPGEDGIVTAEEVGALTLEGTWLVALSACETGSGEARAGEGVMGLRRGFIQAGAQNLLLTLWPVDDETTAQFMTDFYAAAQQSGDAPSALTEVQRAWLTKLRAEHGVLGAVNLAAPFVMNSTGRP